MKTSVTLKDQILSYDWTRLVTNLNAKFKSIYLPFSQVSFMWPASNNKNAWGNVSNVFLHSDVHVQNTVSEEQIHVKNLNITCDLCSKFNWIL